MGRSLKKNNGNSIIKVEIAQMVRVRKYEVDIENLKKILRESKAKAKITNRYIANELNKPLTLVEHWFRTDKSFSIPDEDIWYQLKKLLEIETDEFDESITTFEIREGVYEKSNRVYDSNGIAPTLTCASAETEKFMVYEDENKINKGEEKMWKNNLEKADLETKELKLVSLFSGIGAFEKSLTQLGVEQHIENFAEVDIDAILSYAAIHIEDFEKVEFEYDTEENMRNWLMERNIGFDFAKGKSKIPKLKKDKLLKLYKACVLGRNLGDVSLIKHEKRDIDLIVGGSPCQDFSVAGKLKGSIWICKECGHEYNPLEQHYSKRSYCPKCDSDKLDKTRSSLLVEYLRAVREIKPKYFVYENVKNIKGKNFIAMFNLFEKELEEYGYKTYNEVLNSKNFGIPQNRERVFVVGIRNDIEKEFEFNKGFNSSIKLKDVLEEVVDEKYYINTERANVLIDKLEKNGSLTEPIVPCDSTIMKPKALDVANCITARYDAGIQNKQSIGVAIAERRKSDNELNLYGTLYGGKWDNIHESARRVYSEEGVAPTITAGGGGNIEPKVATRIGGLFDDEKGKHQAGSVWDVDGISPTLDTMQGGYREPCIVSLGNYMPSNHNASRVVDSSGISPTVMENHGTVTATVVSDEVKEKYRIRKLTPLCCWRLMGFEDEDFYKAQSLGIADSQLYKQAGNSIVTNVLYYIFKNLL